MLGTHLAPRTRLVGHQLHHLGVVWSILDDVEEQLGARLLKLSHLQHQFSQHHDREQTCKQCMTMFDNMVELLNTRKTTMDLLYLF